MGVLSGLAPEGVFRFFEEICGIPHGSSDTGRISDYLVRFAKDRNLEYIQDESGNVIIYKDGTAGYENSAPVMLQGHMDMVCEKTPECDIDFANDGLTLRLEDGVISADGTTLGGDDGIAVAFALAIMDADDIPHPPLECVFTVDEEIGMLGAAALDCSPLKSCTMLNLDSEDEGYLLVSCAGGVCATCHVPVQMTEADGDEMTAARLTVTGLTGGHSGVEIIKQRANADKLLGRLLYNIGKEVPYELASVSGGFKDNAIPKEAAADVVIAYKDVDNFRKSAEKWESVLRHEYKRTDSGLEVRFETKKDLCGSSVEKGNCQGDDRTYDEGEHIRVMTGSSKKRVISALNLVPNGVRRMSDDIEKLVQTSLNLGILRTERDEVLMSFSVRSSVGSEKEMLVAELECLMDAIDEIGGSEKTAGRCRLTLAGDYPAWEYREESPLRDIMTEVFEEQYGHPPVVQALHAGVECGLFAGKVDGLDCVSFGPDMKDIHTADESMDVASVRRTWEYTLEILRRLK